MSVRVAARSDPQGGIGGVSRAAGDLDSPIAASAGRHDEEPNSGLAALDQVDSTKAVESHSRAASRWPTQLWGFDSMCAVKRSRMACVVLGLVSLAFVLAQWSGSPSTALATYLQVGVPYTAPENHMTVTINSVDYADNGSWWGITVTYTQANDTSSTTIDEGQISLAGRPQYGSFGTLYPGQQLTRSYSWNVFKSEGMPSWLRYEYTDWRLTPPTMHTSLYWDATYHYSQPDTTAPTTTCDATSTYDTGAATIHLTALDDFGGSGLAKTEYNLDSSGWSEGTLVHVVSHGDHALEYRSIDTSGNVEDVREARFTVEDRVAPTTRVPSLEPSAVVSQTCLVLVATDNYEGSGVAHTYYSLDSGPQIEGTAISGLAEGPHSLDFWSVDNDGNEELPHHRTDLFVDLSAPESSCETSPAPDASGWICCYPEVSLSATDSGSGTDKTYYNLHFEPSDAECRSCHVTAESNPAMGSGCHYCHGGAFTPKHRSIVYVAPMTLSVEGTVTVDYWSVDRLGHVEARHSTTIRVDMTPPETRSSLLVGAQSFVGTATITLNPSDAISGVVSTAWRLDGGDWNAGTELSVSTVGSHTLEFGSTDAAGNSEATKTAAFSVVPPPTVVSTRLSLSNPPTGRLKKLHKVSGRISSPDAPGKVKLVYKRYLSRKWQTVTTVYAPITRGAFSHSYKPRYRGSWRVYASYAGQSAGNVIYRNAPTVYKGFKVK